MRVLHFLDSLNRGGAETLALDVCRNAHRFGLEVTLATCGGGALEEEFRDSGVEVVRLPRRLPIDPGVVRALRRLIRERRLQILHGHQAVDGAHIHLAARTTDARTVLSFHGFVPDGKNRAALRFLIPRTHANLVVSGGLKRWLRDHDGLDTSEFRVVHNGVDRRRIEPAGASLRSELGIPASAPLAAMVGNFYRDPRKDQLTVVKALPRVLSVFPDARFLFVGGVEQGAESKLEECRRECESSGIAASVGFLGARRDVPDILAALDVFVISSLQEGLPIALVEAMLAGVPVLASDIEPHFEASEGGRSARLFRTQDAAHLAENLIALFADAAERRRLAADAGEHAARQFSIDAHLATLAALYEELVREGSR